MNIKANWPLFRHRAFITTLQDQYFYITDNLLEIRPFWTDTGWVIDCSSEEFTILRFGKKLVNDMGIRANRPFFTHRAFIMTIQDQYCYVVHNLLEIRLFWTDAGWVFECSSEELTIWVPKFGQKRGNGKGIMANMPQFRHHAFVTTLQDQNLYVTDNLLEIRLFVAGAGLVIDCSSEELTI